MIREPFEERDVRFHWIGRGVCKAASPLLRFDVVAIRERSPAARQVLPPVSPAITNPYRVIIEEN